jgi:hypothetical protein
VTTVWLSHAVFIERTLKSEHSKYDFLKTNIVMHLFAKLSTTLTASNSWLEILGFSSFSLPHNGICGTGTQLNNKNFY